MPNYRRYWIRGGTYFFTIKTEFNAPIFANPDHIRLLGIVFREMIERWPVEIPAIVLLPDHLHTLWTLPNGDTNYPTRWAWLKKEFTQRYLESGGSEQRVSSSRQRNRRRGVWQRRYWEHAIRDEQDFENHFDYIHWNPVKHGYAISPSEWPHSSFHRWVKEGVYDSSWGRMTEEPEQLKGVLEAGE